jgi:hypothetical protein
MIAVTNTLGGTSAYSELYGTSDWRGSQIAVSVQDKQISVQTQGSAAANDPPLESDPLGNALIGLLAGGLLDGILTGSLDGGTAFAESIAQMIDQIINPEPDNLIPGDGDPWGTSDPEDPSDPGGGLGGW